MSALRVADSWWVPSDAQLAAAKAGGLSGWAGYFSNGNDGIYGGGWADADFRRVMAAGLHTLAFCSTRANPATWKARGAALGIRIVADVERSVQGGDGPTVDPWLATSGASLYGSGPRFGTPNVMTTHLPHGHAGYIVSDYTNAPGAGAASWPIGDPRPTTPTAWQYSGGQNHPWGNTDLGMYDPAFFSMEADMTAAESAQLAAIYTAVIGHPQPGQGDMLAALAAVTANPTYGNQAIINAINAVGAAVTKIGAPSGGGSGLTADQAAQLTSIQTTLATIEAALKNV